jgi:signal transduction histidine kinase/CheY-like chemotaxis protein
VTFASNLRFSRGFLPQALDRLWRRLPLAAQLAIIVVSVTLAWGVLARSLTTRQELRAAAATAEAASLARLEIATLDLRRLSLQMQSMQRGYLLTFDSSLIAEVPELERQVAELTDTLRAALTAYPEASQALDDWQAAFAAWRRPYRVLNAQVADGSLRADAAEIRDAITTGRTQFDAGAAALDRLRSTVATQREIARELTIDQTTLDTREQSLLRLAVLAIVIFLLVLVTRTVRSTLATVVTGAEALAEGAYDQARLPPASDAPSIELQRLAVAFERLSVAVVQREASLHGEVRTLRELEQMKTEFVATVSHELRTPLTSIRGALGLVVGGSVGAVPTQVIALLRIALDNTERLIRLINDILDVEKAEAGPSDAVVDRVDVSATVSSVVAGLETVAREQQVSVVLDVDADLAIMGSADRVAQVVTNLVSNAIKFSPREGTVIVRVKRDERSVLIAVRDHGPGIPEEFRSRIFGRFQQATGTQGGTGLGLAIAKRITQQMGGAISFESEVGAGTTFIVRLPLAEELPPTLPSDAPVRPCVLVADPDASMREVLGALFAPDMAVVGARTSVELLHQLRAGNVRALILEPMLADGSAIDVIARVRAIDTYRDVPVLIFTADDRAATAAADAGIDPTHIMRKTRDPETKVVRRVRAMLAAHGAA